MVVIAADSPTLHSKKRSAEEAVLPATLTIEGKLDCEKILP
jgi:hypothetical protein